MKWLMLGMQEKKDFIALKELQKQKLMRNGFVGGFSIVLLFCDDPYLFPHCY
jgi:hypothetical protein